MASTNEDYDDEGTCKHCGRAIVKQDGSWKHRDSFLSGCTLLPGTKKATPK